MASAPIDVQVKVKGLSDLQKLEKRMETLERDYAKLARIAPKAANGIRETGRAAGTATGNIQRMGVAFRTTLGPVVALYGAINFFNKSLNTFGEREADVNLLTAGIKRLGGTEVDLARLNKQADAFGNATLFNQEDFTQSAGLLTSFTDVAVKDYQRIIDISGDLAQTNKTGLKDSTLQLAKALNDPVANLTALSRAGIQFSDVQKDLIKNLVKTGDKAKAQELILKELERQYGGAAKAAATGLAGAQDTLGEEFRDFQEVVGKGLLPVMTDFVKGLTEIFRELKKIDPEIITAAARFAELALKIGAVLLAIKGLVALKGLVVGFFSASTVAALKLNAALLANPWTALAAGLTVAGVAAYKFWKRQKDLNALMNGSSTDLMAYNDEIYNTRGELQKAKDKMNEYIEKGKGWEKRLAVQKKLVAELEAKLKQLEGNYDVQIRISTVTTEVARGNSKGFQNKLQNTIDELKARGYDYNNGDPIKITTPDLADVGGGGGGGGGGAAAPAPKTDDLVKLQETIRMMEQIAPIQDKINIALLKGDQLTAARLQGEKAVIEEMFAGEEALRGMNTEQGKALQDRINTLKLEEILTDNAQQLLEIEKQRKQTIEGILVPIQDEIALLQGRLNGNEKEIRQNQEILALKKQILAVDPNADTSGVAAMVQQRDQLLEQAEAADELKKRYEALANSVAGELTGAFKDVITGAKSTEEALSDAFKNIGEAFIDMALQMIQQWLVMKALGMFAGGAGGSAAGIGGSFLGGSNAFSSMLPFAEGGYVTGPTPALIGEGGEGETVIPDSKMSEAMTRYANGARGESVVPGKGGEGYAGGGSSGGTIVNYNGPTLSFNSEDYVPASAVPGIIDAAAKRGAKTGEQRTFMALRNSRSQRSRIGL